MGTAIKHPMPDLVKTSFVIFDTRALWRSALSHCCRFRHRSSKHRRNCMAASSCCCPSTRANRTHI